MTSNMLKNDVKQIRPGNGHHGLSMLINWLICVIFTACLPILISGNNSKPFYTKSDLIIDSFVIKSNTIIRTSDSMNAGARYLLSETEMSSNQQCLLLCWDNRNCTLAVYEEKSQGICYLFDCGPPDQMKCKFTGHDHYTSSLIKFNRNSVDGNAIDQRNQAKHESDLVSLRTLSTSTTSVKPIPVSNNSNGVYVTSTTSGSLIPPPSSGSPTYTSTSASVNACKRHQFQCRNSSDCIAIYNVCDGIVQCSDGSDEAIDLHCPSEPVYASIESQLAIPPPNSGSNHQRPSSQNGVPTSPSSSFSASSVPSSVSSSTINFSNSQIKNDDLRKNDLKENEGTDGIKNNHPFGPKKQIDAADFNYPKSPDFVTDLKETGRLPMNSHKYNDYNPARDKFESKSYYPNYGSQYYQPPPPPPPQASGTHGDFYGGPRARGFASDSDYPNNFPRDVNYWQPETGLVGPSANMRSNSVDHSLINSIYHQYRATNDMGPMSINSNGGIASHPQPSTLIRSVPWSKNSYIESYPHKSNEPPVIQEAAPRMELIETQGSGAGGGGGGGITSEENNNRQNLPVRIPQEYPTPIRKPKNSQSLADDVKEHANKAETITRPVLTTDSSLTSPKPTLQVTSDKGVAHLNSDKMINNWEMPVAVTHLSSSQSGRDTNSAVIALVLGVGITAMLITLVGCRMKYIKRRIARRGRNLAHDADYLVNGMYL